MTTNPEEFTPLAQRFVTDLGAIRDPAALLAVANLAFVVGELLVSLDDRLQDAAARLADLEAAIADLERARE